MGLQPRLSAGPLIPGRVRLQIHRTAWAPTLTQVVAGGVCLLDKQVSGSYRDLKHLDVTFVGMWGDKAK